MTLKIKRLIFNLNTLLCFVNTTGLIILIYSHDSFYNNVPYILLTISLLSLITTVILQLFYKKSLSTEIIFLSIFVLSASFQVIRAIEPLIKLNSFLVRVQISRFILFCKYLGLLSLLGASLFSYCIKKQKIGSWLTLSVIASITLSTIIHFNTGLVESNLLSKIIYSHEEVGITFFIILMTVMTYIKTGFDTKNKDYIFLGIACLLISTGLQLTYVSINILPGIISIALMSSGFIIYLRSIHNITLWG